MRIRETDGLYGPVAKQALDVCFRESVCASAVDTE